jgi:hypothetical protein
MRRDGSVIGGERNHSFGEKSNRRDLEATARKASSGGQCFRFIQVARDCV